VNSDTTPEGPQANFQKAQVELRSALAVPFNTPRAMRVLYELIKEANIRINTHKAAPDIRGLENIARWITTVVGISGLDANAIPPYNGLG
jgi:cysteinyl-tRNA synthetase